VCGWQFEIEQPPERTVEETPKERRERLAREKMAQNDAKMEQELAKCMSSRMVLTVDMVVAMMLRGLCVWAFHRGSKLNGRAQDRGRVQDAVCRSHQLRDYREAAAP
jgi:hypothetical protein